MMSNLIDGHKFDDVRFDMQYNAETRKVRYVFENIEGSDAGDFFEWIGSHEDGVQLLINVTAIGLYEAGQITKAQAQAVVKDVP
jgi:hypothetical protein